MSKARPFQTGFGKEAPSPARINRAMAVPASLGVEAMGYERSGLSGAGEIGARGSVARCPNWRKTFRSDLRHVTRADCRMRAWRQKDGSRSVKGEWGEDDRRVDENRHKVRREVPDLDVVGRGSLRHAQVLRLGAVTDSYPEGRLGRSGRNHRWLVTVYDYLQPSERLASAEQFSA